MAINRRIFEKAGFEKVDKVEPIFELHAILFSNDTPLPKINPVIPKNINACGEGITILDGHQCPYVQTVIDPIEEYADNWSQPST